MKIILKNELARIYLDILDMIESLMSKDPKKPKVALAVETEKIRKQIFTSPDTIREFPSYLVLAILEQVKFQHSNYTCLKYENGFYPDWAEIKKNVRLSTNLHAELNKLKSYTWLEEHLSKSFFLVFCLKNQKNVQVELSEIASGDIYQETEYEERNGDEYDY